MELYRISATGISVNYLPQYLAEELGFFEKQGLQIETLVPDSWINCLKDIDSGAFQAVCGGIWVPSMYISHHVAEYRTFAKISSKCPFKLVGRSESKNFNWQQLEHKTILIPCNGGASAYIFLLGTLKDKGVNTKTIRFVHDFMESMLLDCFAGGTMGDYLFCNPVSADRLAEDERFFIAAEMVKNDQPNPWSVYYATAESAEKDASLHQRFAYGLQQGLDWIRSHQGQDCLSIFRKKWPQSNPQVLAQTVDLFIQHRMWEQSIVVGKEEYEAYARYQVDAGIIDKVLPYERIMTDYLNNLS